MLTLAVQAFAAQAPASGAAPVAAESNKRELQGWYQEPSVLSSTWTEAHAQQQQQQPTTCGSADLKTAEWCERKVAKIVAKGVSFELPDMSLLSGGPHVAPFECYDLKPEAWCQEKAAQTTMVEDEDGVEVRRPSSCPRRPCSPPLLPRPLSLSAPRLASLTELHLPLAEVSSL